MTLPRSIADFLESAEEGFGEAAFPALSKKAGSCGMMVCMSKRSRRIAKRNALQAVEDAIGSSLGKTPIAKPPGNTGSEARDARIERPLRRPKRKVK